MSGAHVPVMLDEVMAVLQPRDDAIYVDGTFGGGGYSAALARARAHAGSSASTAMPKPLRAAARSREHSMAA